MATFDLTDPSGALPSSLVPDSSLLLALRKDDDNPQAGAAYRFIERIGQEIAERKIIVWLLAPVLQECYHIILSRSLRRSWAAMPVSERPPNWLATYKQQPELLSAGFADLTTFDEILASIPVTPVFPRDFDNAQSSNSLEKRMLHFITAYYLLPQDALILAEAERIGVSAVATLDSDWRRVKEFDIYTVLP